MAGDLSYCAARCEYAYKTVVLAANMLNRDDLRRLVLEIIRLE